MTTPITTTATTPTIDDSPTEADATPSDKVDATTPPAQKQSTSDQYFTPKKPLPKKTLRLHFQTDDVWDRMAGMPNEGISVSEIAYNSAEDNYAITSGGLFTGYAPNAISYAPWTPTRFNIGIDYTRVEAVEYSNGTLHREHTPSFSLDFLHTPFLVREHSVTGTMSTAQFNDMQEDFRSGSDGFNTSSPDCGNVSLDTIDDCYEAYAEWMNENRDAGEQFNDMIQNLGNGYDITDDFSGAYNQGAYRQVNALSLAATIWLGGETRNYGKPFGILDSGHIGLTGSATYFVGDPFVTNFYAGLGVQAEVALLSYYAIKATSGDRPPPVLDLVGHMGFNAYRGYSEDSGFYGYSFWGHAYAGVGLKLIVPPPMKGWPTRYYENAAYRDIISLDPEKLGF